MLSRGKENARTAKELSEALGCTPRDVTRAIERERRQGIPICASNSGTARGYYLAADDAELALYIRRLGKRAGEIFKTWRALGCTLKTQAGR